RTPSDRGRTWPVTNRTAAARDLPPNLGREPVLRYLAVRLAAGIVLVWVTLTLIFLMLQAVPGDPAMQVLGGGGGDITPEALARVRAELGLDQPVLMQYGAFLLSMLSGSFGDSFEYSQSVASLIGPRLQVTLEIAVLALVLGTVVG